MFPVKISIICKIKKILHFRSSHVGVGCKPHSIRPPPPRSLLAIKQNQYKETNWPNSFHKNLGHGFLLSMDIRATPVWRQMSLGSELLHILSSLNDQQQRKTFIYRKAVTPTHPPPSPSIMTISSEICKMPLSIIPEKPDPQANSTIMTWHKMWLKLFCIPSWISFPSWIIQEGRLFQF